MYCHVHEQTAAVTTCSKCEKPLCEQCAIHLENGVTCKSCLEAGEVKRKTSDRFRKSPTLAGFLSLMPGLGQIYVGYYMNGFVTIAIVAATISVLSADVSEDLAPFLGLFLSFFWIFNIIDAVRRAKLYNQHAVGEETPTLPTDSPLVGGVILLIVGVLLTLGITFDLDMSFVETLWPLAVLGLGIHLLWRYYRTRDKLDRSE
jgi:hypothetical protein